MGHNPRIRTNLTAWNAGAVQPFELDALDQGQFQSINGDLGGVWAPQNQIQIGGAGLRMLGTFTASGSAIFDGDEVLIEATTAHFVGVQPTFDSGIHVTAGDATFEGNATINGSSFDFFGTNFRVHSAALFQAIGDVILGATAANALTVRSTTTFQAEVDFGLPTTFDDPARFNDIADFWGASVTLHTGTTLNVNGPTNLNGAVTLGDSSGDAVTVNGAMDVWSALTVHTSGSINCAAGAIFQHAVQLGTNGSDSIDVPGIMNLHEPLAFSFSGRVPRRAIIGSAVSGNYSITDANEIHVPAGILGVDIAYGLIDAGAKTGDEVVFSNADPTHSVGIRTASSGGVIKANGFNPGFCKFVFIAGGWRLTELVSG